MTVAIEVLGIQDLPDGPGPLADEDRGKGLVWDGARFVAEVAAPGGAAQVHVARGRGKTRIQEAPDGPGTLGASDDDKVQVWDSSAGRFVMRSAYVEVALDEGNTAAENTALLEAAFSGGDVRLLLPPGTFAISNLLLANGGITIRGAGMPAPNDARTALVGGTVLTGGTINFDGQDRVVVCELGVDVSQVSGRDAIKSSGSSANGEQWCQIRNVCTLGSGSGHGCVLSSGDYNVIHNFAAYSFQHGVAVRASYTTVSQIYCEDTSLSTITVKATTDADEIYGVVASNIVGRGSVANAQGPIVVEAHNTEVCAYNVIQGATLENVTRGVQIKTVDNGSGHGVVTACSVSNVRVVGCQYEGLLISGDAVDADVANMWVDDSATYGFRNTSNSTSVRLYNCTTSANPLNGTFDRADVLDYSGSAPVAFINRGRPAVLPFKVTGTGVAWTVPDSAAEFPGTTNYRLTIDLSMYQQIRLSVHVITASGTDAVLYPQLSTNNAAYASVDGSSGASVAVGSTGRKVSGWANLDSSYQIETCYLRLVGESGDDATLGNFGNITLEVK